MKNQKKNPKLDISVKLYIADNPNSLAPKKITHKKIITAEKSSLVVHQKKEKKNS